MAARIGRSRGTCVGQSHNSDEFMVGENEKGECDSLIHMEMACFVQTVNLSDPFTCIVVILLYAVFVKDININNTTKLQMPSMELHMKIDTYNKHFLNVQQGRCYKLSLQMKPLILWQF